jgi:hypothetical protein
VPGRRTPGERRPVPAARATTEATERAKRGAKGGGGSKGDPPGSGDGQRQQRRFVKRSKLGPLYAAACLGGGEAAIAATIENPALGPASSMAGGPTCRIPAPCRTDRACRFRCVWAHLTLRVGCRMLHYTHLVCIGILLNINDESARPFACHSHTAVPSRRPGIEAPMASQSPHCQRI